jgi:hypothetical protein
MARVVSANSASSTARSSERAVCSNCAPVRSYCASTCETAPPFATSGRIVASKFSTTTVRRASVSLACTVSMGSFMPTSTTASSMLFSVEGVDGM